jgi:hypothetical protein
MKKYIYDSFPVLDNCSSAALIRLQREGWKNLQYVAHDSWGDCHCPEIVGNRPMTMEEIKEHDKLVRAHKKKQIRDIRRSANQLGYDLVKKEKV